MKQKKEYRCLKQHLQTNASLTVEAALVLPVFVFAITIFLYFFQFVYLQQSIQSALYQTAGYFSKNAYLYEQIYDTYTDGKNEEVAELFDALGLEESISSSLYKAKFKGYIEQNTLNMSLILGGMEGISIQAQSDYFEEDEVDLCVYYTCKIPVLFFSVDTFDCVQRVRAKNWTGQEAVCLYTETAPQSQTQEEQTLETVVYVTATGTKYHTHSDCTHLKLSVHSSTYGKVGYQRNKNNESYSSCDLCARNTQLTANSIVYITDEGNCYHTSAQCSGIKRTVSTISITEVEGRTCCKRCQKRDENEEE